MFFVQVSGPREAFFNFVDWWRLLDIVPVFGAKACVLV